MKGLLALASLVAVARITRTALYHGRQVPVGRVELAPNQRLWVSAFLITPIAICTAIAVFRARLLAYATDEHLAHTFMYLTGFVVAVIIGIAPRAEQK